VATRLEMERPLMFLPPLMSLMWFSLDRMLQ
jgi:hypothetical protein